MDKMDEGTKRLDDYISMGRYVILVCVLAELMILPQVSSMYYMMYAGASPSLSACGDDLIFDPELDEKEVCRLYHHVALENCSAPSFRYEFKSVNVEWNYICENANIIKNSISVQMIGVLTGSVVFGQLSDLYGRRKGMLGTMTGMAASLLLVAKSATLVQFTVTRTIVGFFTGGSIAVLNVFIMENIPKRHRMWINMVITWSPNIMPMALMAWLSADWRTLAVANAATCVPGILFCLIWIKESPQWLLQRGRINEAIEIMRREFNCFKERDMNNVVEKEYYLIRQTGSRNKHYSFFHLFCSAKLTITTVVLAFSFFSTSIVNYGILFNMEKLSGSIYLNSVYTGLMRYVCNLTLGYADLKFKRIGRKFVHTSGLVIIILSLAFVIIAHFSGLNHTLKGEVRLLILLASSMTSQIYVTTGVVGNELFPTPIRNVGYAFLQLWNRLGVIASPFVFYWATASAIMPYCIMVTLCLIDMLAFECLLPETKGMHLAIQMPPLEERLMKGRKYHRQSTRGGKLVASEV